MKAWTRWLARRPRIAYDPFAAVAVARPGREEVRAAYTREEVALLVSPHPLVPHYRRVVYLVAYRTGLRRGELRRLERSAFDLDAGTVTIARAQAKNRRATVLAISAEVAEAVRAYWREIDAGGRSIGRRRHERPEAAFPEGVPDAIRMRKDRAALGVPHERNGLPLDFHSLRVSLNSHLRDQGVSASVRQRIMRLSDPRLVEGTYLRIESSETRSAIEALDYGCDHGLSGTTETDAQGLPRTSGRGANKAPGRSGRASGA